MKKNSSNTQSATLPTHLKEKKSIVGHPYFHKIKEDEALELLNNDTSNGNCLFCLPNDDTDDLTDYIFLYKSSSYSEIKKIYFKCHEIHASVARSSIKRSDSQVIIYSPNYASLYEAIEKLPEWCETIEKDYLQPILNPSAEKQLKRFVLPNAVLFPLPNEVVSLIFDYLDLKSTYETSLVSKNWNDFFSANLFKTIQLQHREARKKADEHAKWENNEHNSFMYRRYSL